MTAVGAATIDLDRLRSAVRGRVVAPGDDTYDKDRVLVIGGVDPKPAVIVRVADTADVAAVIALARETGLDLAVRSAATPPPRTRRPTAASCSTSAT